MTFNFGANGFVGKPIVTCLDEAQAAEHKLTKASVDVDTKRKQVMMTMPRGIHKLIACSKDERSQQIVRITCETIDEEGKKVRLHADAQRGLEKSKLHQRSEQVAPAGDKGAMLVANHIERAGLAPAAAGAKAVKPPKNTDPEALIGITLKFVDPAAAKAAAKAAADAEESAKKKKLAASRGMSFKDFWGKYKWYIVGGSVVVIGGVLYLRMRKRKHGGN